MIEVNRGYNSTAGKNHNLFTNCLLQKVKVKSNDEDPCFSVDYCDEVT